MSAEFNVIAFDNDGFWRYVSQSLGAEESVIVARFVVDEAIRDGAISRVMITDSDDFTNFLWETDKGVVFPPPVDPASP